MMLLCYHGMVPVQHLCDIGAVTVRFLCNLTKTHLAPVIVGVPQGSMNRSYTE